MVRSVTTTSSFRSSLIIATCEQTVSWQLAARFSIVGTTIVRVELLPLQYSVRHRHIVFVGLGAKSAFIARFRSAHEIAVFQPVLHTMLRVCNIAQHFTFLWQCYGTTMALHGIAITLP